MVLQKNPHRERVLRFFCGIVIAPLAHMTFDENTCYILTMKDGEKITFKIEENAPSFAIHLVKVKDCLTGKIYKLIELLTRSWTNIERMSCSECAFP